MGLASAAVAVALAVSTVATSGGPAAGPAVAGPEQTWLVLHRPGEGVSAAVDAVGGRLVSSWSEVGVAVVRADAGFGTRSATQPGLLGAVPDSPVGRVPAPATGPATAVPGPAAALTARPADEPLAPLQWEMRAIHATASGAHRITAGDRRVLVAILDSGVDASHPDLTANLDTRHGANLTRDIPDLDGPCETPSCVDPVGEDPIGHGTHVAGLVAAARNRLGVAGVAPGVRLVDLRVAQDSGYVFLGPVVAGLLRAAALGADVADLAFTIDPWLFHCPDNPADSRAEQLQQRAAIEIMRRVVEYARSRGVLPVAAIGDQGLDLTEPTVDESSPAYPPGQARPRTIDPASCQVLPAETPGVLTVSRVDRSGASEPSSNRGLGVVDVAAPGGSRSVPGNLLLSTYPQSVAAARGLIGPDGEPTDPRLVRDCRGRTCGYYLYDANAAPLAAGVAALVVSRYGRPDRSGLGLAPRRTEATVLDTASPRACPAGDDGCEGTRWRNGYYGHGLVDALAAVRR